MRMMKLLRPTVPSNQLQPESRLLRTLQAPQHVQHEDGIWRPSSAAFSASRADAACSVDLEQLLVEDGLSAKSLFPSLPKSVGLVALPLSIVIGEGLEAKHDPVESDWYHGGILGAGLKKQGVRKRLAARCESVVPIDATAAAAFQAEATRVFS